MNTYIQPEDLQIREGTYCCDECSSQIEGGEPMYRLLLCDWEWHPKGKHLVSAQRHCAEPKYLCQSCALVEWQKSNSKDRTQCGSCGEALVVEVGSEVTFMPHYLLTRGEFDENSSVDYEMFFEEDGIVEVRAQHRQSPDSVLCPCCADAIAPNALDDSEYVEAKEDFEEMID